MVIFIRKILFQFQRHRETQFDDNIEDDFTLQLQAELEKKVTILSRSLWQKLSLRTEEIKNFCSNFTFISYHNSADEYSTIISTNISKFSEWTKIGTKFSEWYIFRHRTRKKAKFFLEDYQGDFYILYVTFHCGSEFRTGIMYR